MRTPNSCAAPTLHASGRATRRFQPIAPCTRRIMAWALRCIERSAERHALARLGDWQLRDIGISRTDAEVEASKWFWRV